MKRLLTLQSLRLIIQTLGLILLVTGYSAVIHFFGLPKWMFLGSIILFGVFFCGWFCPFGTVQEWIRLLGGKVLGVNLHIPAGVHRYLSFSRYFLLAGGFLLPLFGAIALPSILDSRRAFFMTATGNAIAFGGLFLLAVMLVLSLFVDRPYCRYVCGFGAMGGLLSMVRIFGVKHDADKCTKCKLCDKACGMGVEISLANNIRDPHCINCGKCIAACPVPGALSTGLTLPGRADVCALKRKYSHSQAASSEG